MKNKIITPLTLILTLTLPLAITARPEHTSVMEGLKLIRTADEMMLDLMNKKMEEPTLASLEMGLVNQVPLNAVEIKKSHFQQAISLFDNGLRLLTKNVSNMNIDEHHEIMRKGEHFIADGMQVLEKLAKKTDRRDLAMGFKNAISQYKDYDTAFVNDRVNEFEQEAELAYQEDNAMGILNMDID